MPTPDDDTPPGRRTPCGGDWRERALEAEAKNRELHEQLIAQLTEFERRNATLCAYANRGWARVGILVARTNRLLRLARHWRTAGSEQEATPTALANEAARDDEGGHADALASVGALCEAAADVAVRGDAPELTAACRWLRETLRERHPISDVVAAAAIVGWRWRGLDVRAQEKLRKKWARLCLTAYASHDDIPRKLGRLKKGRTKKDPAEVRARYLKLVASGMAPKVAKEEVAREYRISRTTLSRYFSPKAASGK
jgi:hypothetical protein